MLHYLRIAVTALSLTACVLLVALWMRSYWWCDSIVAQLARTSGLGVTSAEGRIWLKYSASWDTQITTWIIFSVPMRDDVRDFLRQNWPSLGITWSEGLLEAAMPHWFFVVLTAMVGLGSWTCGKWRFSLRTLLIATTLVAVLMGIVVAASK